MRLNVYSAKGIKTEKKIELPEDIFGIKPNPSVLRQYIHAYQTTQRAGTAATKTRGQVSGGGRKPWAQKGTGRARQGSVRSPIWVGGGVSFGPHPRTFAAISPKKFKDLALRSALSAKAAAGRIYVVEDLILKEPKTAFASHLLAKLKSRKSLVIVPDMDGNVFRSFRNLAETLIEQVGNLNPYDVLNSGDLVFFQGSIGKLKERLEEEKSKGEKPARKKVSRPKVRKVKPRRQVRKPARAAAKRSKK